jgi:hypothetical protein
VRLFDLGMEGAELFFAGNKDRLKERQHQMQWRRAEDGWMWEDGKK